MPVEEDVHSFPGKKLLKEETGGKIYSMQDYLRECLVFESRHEAWLLQHFEELTKNLRSLQPLEEEPMFNIITWTEGDSWLLVVFPRKQHRPRQFYETGGNQLLISPGVVDFGGVLITVREEDFNRMDEELLTDIYAQCGL
jgi:hypothetical protein